MKRSAIFPFTVFFLFAASCNNSSKDSPNDDTARKRTTANDTSTTTTTNSSSSGEGIHGDWKLALETYDDNDNKKLDDEERKKAFSNHYFYRFNPDGTCLIGASPTASGAFKGHYEIKQENGRQKLISYMDEEGEKGPEGQYWIISVNKDELVLLESLADHTFWIFKRS